MSTEQKQKVTISEFKSWLRGIRDMLGDEWVPNADQWKRICEKIDSLQEHPNTVPAQPQQTRVVVTSYDQTPPHSQTVPAHPAGPSSLNLPPSPPQPRVVSSPGGVPVLTGPIATNNTLNNPVKTPSIDTTNGKYDSAFV